MLLLVTACTKPAVLGRVSSSATDRHALQVLITLPLVANMLLAVMLSVALSCLYTATRCCCCCWPGHCLHQAGSARQSERQHHDGTHSLKTFIAFVLVVFANSLQAAVLLLPNVDHALLMSY
jgi:hypothetical protein